MRKRLYKPELGNDALQSLTQKFGLRNLTTHTNISKSSSIFSLTLNNLFFLLHFYTMQRRKISQTHTHRHTHQWLRPFNQMTRGPFHKIFPLKKYILIKSKDIFFEYQTFSSFEIHG